MPTQSNARTISRCASMFSITSSRFPRALGKSSLTPGCQIKIHVARIGAGALPISSRRAWSASLDAGLHIAFIGYMSREKGLDFLVTALEHATEDFLSHLSLTVLAENTELGMIDRLLKLRTHCRSVVYHDGYERDHLHSLLKEVDLGVVPNLWEDPLPQIATEMITLGIPIVTSDRGGAQEIVGNSNFVFSADSHGSLLSLLEAVVAGSLPLEEFWSPPPALKSMEEHVEELLCFYDRGLILSPATRC